MARHTGQCRGRYLYAITAKVDGEVYGYSGIEGNPVYPISNGGVSAMVSNVSMRKIRPERRHMAAHQEVLKRLMHKHTVLPMSFGIIADGARAIESILARNHDAILEQLQRVDGKVEMGLRITWDVPNIFEYFVTMHPELHAARDELYSGSREPSHEEKIALGQLFECLLNQDRDHYSQKVGEVLMWHCCEIKRNPCRNEYEVANLACLVGRRAQSEFEAAVFAAASLFDNNFCFDFNGPWAPHNFVDIDLT